LHAGIIKFATLPDHDWTGADQQNFLEIVVPRHLRSAQDKRNRPNFTSSLSFRPNHAALRQTNLMGTFWMH
jgi:hypothetical protein